jgi:hypothetical protein
MLVISHCHPPHHLQLVSASIRPYTQRCSNNTPVRIPIGILFPARSGLSTSCKVFGLEHLTNFGLALPSWPVFFVELHEADCRFDRLLFRFQLKLSEAADNLLGLDKRSVRYGYASSGKPKESTLHGGPGHSTLEESWPKKIAEWQLPPAPSQRKSDRNRHQLVI